MRKNVIVDFYISCNAAVTDKYVLTYVSNISRINIESWTTYWNLWLKWYIYTHDISIPHYSRWQFTVETSKNAKYDTNTIYVGMKYYSHWQIHMYIDT